MCQALAGDDSFTADTAASSLVLQPCRLFAGGWAQTRLLLQDVLGVAGGSGVSQALALQHCRPSPQVAGRADAPAAGGHAGARPHDHHQRAAGAAAGNADAAAGARRCSAQGCAVQCADKMRQR
jgi:hypothetical protein